MLVGQEAENACFSDANRCLRPFHRAPEPGISGLEKTAPPGELEFFSRSN